MVESREETVVVSIARKPQELVEKFLDSAGIGPYRVVQKNEIIIRSPLKLIKRCRNVRAGTLILVCEDLTQETRMFMWATMMVLMRAKRRRILDLSGRTQEVSRLRYFLHDLPGIVLYLLQPLFYVCYSTLYILLTRPAHDGDKGGEVKRVAYLRTDTVNEKVIGGSIAHISGVINAFNSLGYRVSLFSQGKIDLVDEAMTEVILIPSTVLRNFVEVREMAYNLTFFTCVKKYFDRSPPDMIYHRYSLNNYVGVRLANRYRIPLVLEYNGPLVWVSKNWGCGLFFSRVSEMIELYGLKSADLIVVVSKPLLDELVGRGVDGRKVLVNSNGVDVSKFRPDLDGSKIRQRLELTDKVVVGFVGTFGPWHGAEVLAKAVKGVVMKNPNVHFLFVGDGSTMPQVRGIVAASKMEGHVTFTGLVPQDEVPLYLAACDILASPHVPNPDGTPFFGSPTKLFEYMAMGKPIVASRLDQIGEVLADGDNALMVEPLDVNGLVERILLLASDEKLRTSLGKKAREDALSKHTWERNVQRVIEKLKSMRR